MKQVTEKKYKVLTWGTWFVIIGLWLLLTETGLVASRLVPSPIQVLKTFGKIVKEGYNGISFWQHGAISLYRLTLATTLAVLTAVPLGLLSGYFKPFRAIVDSVVQFYRPLPPLAYYTLLILWLGIDETSKVTLLYLAAFAPIYLACVSAVGNLSEELLLLSAESLGASKRQIFLTIVLPGSLPEIFTGLRTAVGVAYTTLVSAEMIAATSGIGWMVIDASRYLKSDVMFVGIILMGLTGILLDLGLRKIEQKLIFWKGKS